MAPLRPPQSALRAKSHAGSFASVAIALGLILCVAPLVGCGETKGETPDGVAGPAPDGAGQLAGPAAGGDRPLVIDDGDLMDPVYGERSLAPDAIEVDPYQLMPRGLPITEEDRATVVELVRALQPLDPSLTSDHHDRWFIENKRRIEALEASERAELGWAALHAFTNYPERHFTVRRTLLGVGARVAPETARPILVKLSFNYGHYIEDRSEALLLLAETSPEDFFEGSRAYIERPGQPFQTAPNDEFFVRGWVIACEKSGESPVPMMAQVATNLALEDYARVVALRSLAKYADDPRARGAIRTALVESTGNGYLRRISAQTVLSGFPRETACALLQEVLDREADINFGRFLDDMIQLNCR